MENGSKGAPASTAQGPPPRPMYDTEGLFTEAVRVKSLIGAFDKATERVAESEEKLLRLESEVTAREQHLAQLRAAVVEAERQLGVSTVTLEEYRADVEGAREVITDPEYSGVRNRLLEINAVAKKILALTAP